MNQCIAFAVVFILLFSCFGGFVPDSEPVSAPAVRNRDEVFASGMEEAWRILAERYREGMDHYIQLQEEDNALMAEYGGFAGNSPLYIEWIDITGDGQPEMLFLATRDDVEDWNRDSADLFVYTWKGDHAEQILWIEALYVIAGNGPWYEIYMDGNGSGDLYVSSGCDLPGTQARYSLNRDGQYFLAGSVSAYCDYEAITDETDGFIYYADNATVTKAEYEAARDTLTAGSWIPIASTIEVVP